MSQHGAISPTEAADRLSIRELVEAYAHCADRRDANGQMALFTANAHVVVYMDAKDPTPTQEFHSRAALAPVFDDLNKYAATQHLVGQSTIFTLGGDRATGETARGSLPSAGSTSTGSKSASCREDESAVNAALAGQKSRGHHGRDSPYIEACPWSKLTEGSDGQDVGACG
jgi:hypothetical protein